MIETTKNIIITTNEHWALLRFRDLPNLDENKNVTSEDCYNPHLYKRDGYWTIAWLNNEGVEIMSFVATYICDVIDAAYDWLNENVFKDVTCK